MRLRCAEGMGDTRLRAAVVTVVEGAEQHRAPDNVFAVQASRRSTCVDPRRIGRGERAALNRGVGQEPSLHRRRLVGGEVVADHVDCQAGIGLAVDLVQEVAEVHRPVLVRTACRSPMPRLSEVFGARLGGSPRGWHAPVRSRELAPAGRDLTDQRAPHLAGAGAAAVAGPETCEISPDPLLIDKIRVRWRGQVPGPASERGSGRSAVDPVKSRRSQSATAAAQTHRQMRCTLVGEIPACPSRRPLRPRTCHATVDFLQGAHRPHRSTWASVIGKLSAQHRPADSSRDLSWTRSTARPIPAWHVPTVIRDRPLHPQGAGGAAMAPGPPPRSVPARFTPAAPGVVRSATGA